MLTDMPGGREQGHIYLIEYNEELWLSYSEESKQRCKDEWTRKATPIPNCRFVVLRLHPDPLFPMYGHEKPYTAWQWTIVQPNREPFTVEAVITVTMRGSPKFIEPMMRADISRALEGAGAPGTAWRIVSAAGHVIEHGRL